MREGYFAYWPHAGFPTNTSGPYETAEDAWKHIDDYTGPEKIKLAAYVMKHEMKRIKVARPATKAAA